MVVIHKFDRDPELERLALEAGWSIDKIKRTRLIDIEFAMKENQNSLQEIKEYNAPIYKGADVIDFSAYFPTGLPFEQTYTKSNENVLLLNDKKLTYERSGIHEENISKNQDKVDEYEINELSIKRKQLESQLDEITSQENYITQSNKQNLIIEEVFNVRTVCKLQDAPLRIKNYYESICLVYKTQYKQYIEKQDIIIDIDDEFDDEERSLIQQIVIKDQDKLRVQRKKLKALYNDLLNVIEKRSNILKIFDNTFEKQHYKIFLRMKGKLKKLQIILLIINEKINEWTIFEKR